MPRYVSLIEASAMLAEANRVLVIGCSGAGKTPFSQKIANSYGLEFRSLDRPPCWSGPVKLRGVAVEVAGCRKTQRPGDLSIPSRFSSLGG